MPETPSSDGVSRAQSARPSVSHIDLDHSLISWDPSQPGRGSASTIAVNRRKIRSQASRSSAVQRKTTMAAKVKRPPPQLRTPSSSNSSTTGNSREEPLLQAERLHAALNQSRPGPADSAGPQHVDFQNFVGVIDALQTHKNFLTRELRETTLAQTSIRGDMRDAFTISPALFQATLFIAGTFSNTCGVSYADVKLGFGMAFMRGASLDAVRSAITPAEGEHWVSMAVALLAGWELRFGDKESYAIHMKAYRGIFGAPLDLEENSTAMLRDFAYESLREQLNTMSLAEPLRSSKPSATWNIAPGFDVFSPVLAPEVKSLLSIVRDTARFDPRAPGALQFIRNQGLKALSWTPHHGESVEPSSTFEGQWDPLELIALLHVRAAILGIIAIHSHICHTMHQATTYLDIMAAADVHAHSCGHLKTDALIGTKFQWVAIWARVSLAAISRDPSRDGLFKHWFAITSLNTWKALRDVMEYHLLQDAFHTQTRTLFHEISQDVDHPPH